MQILFYLLELLSIAFVLSKLAVVLGFADKWSFSFFLHNNNPNFPYKFTRHVKFRFSKDVQQYSRKVLRSTWTHEHSKIKLLSPAKINLLGLPARWNTLLRFHSIFDHQASKLFKENNRPTQFWCISTDYTSVTSCPWQVQLQAAISFSYMYLCSDQLALVFLMERCFRLNVEAGFGGVMLR